MWIGNFILTSMAMFYLQVGLIWLIRNLDLGIGGTGITRLLMSLCFHELTPGRSVLPGSGDCSQERLFLEEM